MSRERDLLEAFYFRDEPLGITFFGPDFSRPLEFGRPGNLVLPYLGFTAGFMQAHLEYAGLCLFFAKLETGEALLAQYPFQELEQPLNRSWLRFVHLATLFSMGLDRGPLPDLPSSDALVPRPHRPPSWLRIAHAKPESEISDEP